MIAARRVALVIALLLAGVSTARAAVESPEVLAGIAAYRDLDYDRAIDILQKAVRQTLTREEKTAAYRTLALAYVAADKRESAIRAFVNVLRIDESFELDRTSSPRERSAFEEAKSRFATGQTGDKGTAGRELSSLRATITPLQPKAGDPIKMRVIYPGGMLEKLSLFYRTRGLGLYNRMVAGGDATGHFELTVPGNKVEAPGLEYYMVGLDDSGASVAKAGSLPRPLSINVLALKKPVYKKGWFWGIIAGVAIAGAAAGTAVYLTRPNINSSTPTAVTIMPY